uniref:Uncharacterized protein n=1 Tax=Romanomermis culicivorax TaxID=13658 RepID=A0A915JTA8_ROMCU
MNRDYAALNLKNQKHMILETWLVSEYSQPDFYRSFHEEHPVSLAFQLTHQFFPIKSVFHFGVHCVIREHLALFTPNCLNRLSSAPVKKLLFMKFNAKNLFDGAEQKEQLAHQIPK